MHSARQVVRTLVVWRHNHAVPITFRNLTIKFDDLHEAGTFVDLTKLPLKLVEDASPVRKIVFLVYDHILWSMITFL